MRRRKYYKTNRRYKKRGRGVPYIYNNRVYLGKKHKKELGQFHFLQNFFHTSLEGLLDFKRNMFGLSIEKNQREKTLKNIRQNEAKVLVTDLIYYIC